MQQLSTEHGKAFTIRLVGSYLYGLDCSKSDVDVEIELTGKVGTAQLLETLAGLMLTEEGEEHGWKQIQNITHQSKRGTLQPRFRGQEMDESRQNK